MEKNIVVSKLKKLQEKIPDLKSKGVLHQQTADFEDWFESVSSWLTKGKPYATDEIERFKKLNFSSITFGLGGRSFSQDDQRLYNKALEGASLILDAAIENLEEGWSAPSDDSRNGAVGPNVKVGNAQAVIVGDRNTTSIANTITVGDFLKVLERQVQNAEGDPKQKTELAQKLKDFAKHPLAVTTIGQTLGHVLRTFSGQ
ncbi:MAG: hypothetical protein HY401_06740 [Elusimicrobia bacterium]|nr:hypothetical protein [Elusimicrobiota bacterium]